MNTKHNVGHGHVISRPDGVKARCGGPALCRECRFESALRQIYSGAIAIERGEEPIVEVAQNIQRLCDDALRGLPLREIYIQVQYP